MAEENYRIYWTEKADGRGIIKKGKYLADNRNFLIGLSDKLHSTKYRLVEVRDEDNALGFKISETDNLFPEGAMGWKETQDLLLFRLYENLHPWLVAEGVVTEELEELDEVAIK